MTATSWLARPDHPVASAVAGMHAELDLIEGITVASASADELAACLPEATRLPHPRPAYETRRPPNGKVGFHRRT